MVLGGTGQPGRHKQDSGSNDSIRHRRFEALFNQPHTMAMILDEEGTVRRLNEKARSFVPDTETVVSEPLWETPWVTQSPTSATRFRERLSRVQDGETLRYEKRCHHPEEGEVMLDVTLQPVVDPQDRIDSILLFARDITDRWHRQQELERLRDRMELALEVTESIIWTVDLDAGTLTDLYGPPLERYDLDVSPEVDLDAFEDSTRQSPFEEVIHPADIDTVTQAYHAVRTGETDIFDITFRTAPEQGEPRWVSVTATVSQQDDRRLLTGLTTDITDQKRQQAELERQNERLDAFASVVSHDLRNPVSIAAGYLDLARQTGDPDHFDRIEAALDRMETLIDDLLTLAREGNGELSLEPVALSQVVREAWAGTQTAEATLAVELAERTVMADPSQLKQVFENVFRNAIEHTGSDVTVTVGWLPDGDGFYIVDDGPGIPESKRDTVCEPGYSTQEDGTGLGLTIIDTIVDAHGWDLTITAGDAGGARFEITGVTEK